MGNDCEECGAQIPYGENKCQACEMGITDEYRRLSSMLNLNKAQIETFKEQLSKLVYALKDSCGDHERETFEEEINRMAGEFFKSGQVTEGLFCEACNAKLDFDLICQECDGV
jgi:hypothetical protein